MILASLCISGRCVEMMQFNGSMIGGIYFKFDFDIYPQWGGGGTLIFSAYVGSDPASTVHPKKYQQFRAPQKNILKF